jgi:hypothetical protein
VKGYDSTIGYTQWGNKPAERDAAVRPTHSVTHFLPTDSNCGIAPHPIRRRSRRCAQRGPSSSPRRTYHRPCSPLRAVTRSGAARSTRGQLRTPRAALQAVKPPCSLQTARRSAWARTSAGAYAFPRDTVVSMGSSLALAAYHMPAASVREAQALSPVLVPKKSWWCRTEPWLRGRPSSRGSHGPLGCGPRAHSACLVWHA